MMKLKYNMLITVFLSLFIFSCEKEPVNSDDDSKFVSFESSTSVIPKRIQFSKNINYHFKIALETNYLKAEGFLPKLYFVKGNLQIPMDLYDDGVSDGVLRNDLAASNNIWSGGINASDFPAEGEWEIQIDYTLNTSTVLRTESAGKVYAVTNYLPEITQVAGLEPPIVFASGFDTKTITVAVTDSNNLAEPYDEQYLNFQLFTSTGTKLKEKIYTRPNVDQDFNIYLDSTYAAGIRTLRNYRFKIIATDLYGESSVKEYTNVTIRNYPPSLYNLQYPDTVLIPQTGSVYFSVKVNVNDPQGHLEYQDIKEVVMTVNATPIYMRDDGNENFYPYNSGDVIKNDGIYTATFKLENSESLGEIYPFTIQAMDKVDSLSQAVSGQLIFIKEISKSIKRSKNENNFIYTNPFN